MSFFAVREEKRQAAEAEARRRVAEDDYFDDETIEWGEERDEDIDE